MSLTTPQDSLTASVIPPEPKLEIPPWMNILPQEEIVRILKLHDMPLDEWGTGKWRSLADFVKYMTEDQFWFQSTVVRPLTIEVNSVVVRVYHDDLELYEKFQENRRTGARIQRPEFDGVGETMKKYERVRNGRLDSAATRCLGEELEWYNPREYLLSGLYEIQHRPVVLSEKWPGGPRGLWAIYHRHIVECRPSPSLFKTRAEGFVHQDRDWDIHFAWRLREDA